MRSGRGEVVSSFGAVQGPRWTGKGWSAVRVELLEEGENSLISSYKYMFQRLRDVRDGKAMQCHIGCGFFQKYCNCSTCMAGCRFVFVLHETYRFSFLIFLYVLYVVYSFD